MIKREDIEIMAPAGSYESLMAAINAGADSVYFGVEKLNMRARSSANFTLEDLAKIVEIAKKGGVKTYLTVNTVLYDDEIATMRSVIDRAKAEGVTAIIAADQAAIIYARSQGVEVHISTQLNVSNSETLRFYAQYADVVVLARELTLPQIEMMHKTIIEECITGPSGELVKIEMFAHGAMCMAISGKCYLSLHETNCSANRGACRQMCRRDYEIKDRDTGEVLHTQGGYILSPKDLCTIEFLDKFIGAGVRVLKIEGRARSGEYVKRVVECYNEALLAIEGGTYNIEFSQGLTKRLSEVFNRGFWGGYYCGTPTAELSEQYGSSATKKKVYVGKVTNYFKKIGVVEVQVEAALLESDSSIVILGDTTGVVEFTMDGVFVDEKPTTEAIQGQVCSILTPEPVRRGDKLYKIVDA